MAEDRDDRAAGEGDDEVTRADVERLQEAHGSDPKQSRDTSESLNKPTDPSLNDQDAPVAKGVGSY